MCINSKRKVIIHNIEWLKLWNEFIKIIYFDLIWLTNFSSAAKSVSGNWNLWSRVTFKSHLSIFTTSAFATSIKIFLRGLSLNNDNNNNRIELNLTFFLNFSFYLYLPPQCKVLERSFPVPKGIIPIAKFLSFHPSKIYLLEH